MEKVTDRVHYVGTDDKTLDLFESQYVLPNGISYNSYIIHDNKTVIMDAVDKRMVKEWLENVKKDLEGKEPEYLVVSHLEPDHSGGIEALIDLYPTMKIIVSQVASNMIPQFIHRDLKDKLVLVKEGEVVDLGEHKLQFFMAPMVHWPEVMVTYEHTEKILFSADGFGKFGTLDMQDDWDCEARRYYFNIVGRFGAQVQALLKKASSLDIKMICPLHGPILKQDLEYYINKYDIWSSYKPEDNGILIAYNSIHGNTEEAVLKLAQMLKENGEEKVVVSNLAREDMAEVLEDAFRYDRMIMASPTYDMNLFPDTEKFLRRLKHKNYQNRKVAIIQNGSWAPASGKLMKDLFSEMKNVEIVEPMITIKTRMTEETEKQMEELVKNICKRG